MKNSTIQNCNLPVGFFSYSEGKRAVKRAYFKAIFALYCLKTSPKHEKLKTLFNFFFFCLQYFNYMGMLAVEGTYDKMEALLSLNIQPVDILLMMASSEGDQPKIEELLRAGAKYDVKDGDGRTALDRAANDEIRDLILNYSAQKA